MTFAPLHALRARGRALRTTPRQWHLYALIDPLESEVRYIGMTCQPEKRERNHAVWYRSTGAAKQAWTRNLEEEGLAPWLWVFNSFQGTVDQARDEEARVIRMALDDGFRLLNEVV